MGDRKTITGAASAPLQPSDASKASAAAILAQVKATLKDCAYVDVNALREGFAHERVKLLQEKLKAAGFDVEVSGVLTAATKKALWAFQQAQRKNDPSFLVDGKAGQQTWARLLGVPGRVKPGRELLTIPALVDPDAPATPSRPRTPAAAPSTFSPADAGRAQRPAPVQIQAPAGPQAQSAPARAPKPAEAVATVGDVAIRPQDVQRLVNSETRASALNDVLTRYAEQLKVAPIKGEGEEAFVGRLGAAAKAAGVGDALASDLKGLDQASLQQAVLRLTAPEIAKQALAAAHKPVPDNAQPPAIFDAFKQLVADDIHKPVDSKDTEDEVNDRLMQGTLDATWQAHHTALDAELETFKPDQRAGAKDFLVSAYYPYYGVLAPEQIAKELKANGPARQLLDLLKAKPTNVWTVWDLRDTLKDHPELAKTFAPKDPANPDPLMDASVRVSFQAGPEGFTLKPDNGRIAALLQDVKAGKLRVHFTGAGDFQVLDRTGAAVGSDTDVAAALDQLSGPLDRLQKDLAAAWKAGKPLDDVLKQSGLSPYLGEKPLETAWLIPGMAEGLKTQVLADALGGATPDTLVAKGTKLGAPEASTKELVDLQSRLQALQQLHPLPPELGLATLSQSKNSGLKIPLEPGTKLSAAQTAALAAVQRYLDIVATAKAAQIGGPPPITDHYGTLDANSIKRLKAYASVKDGEPLDLNADFMKGLLSDAAASLEGRSTTSGELIFRHPVVARMAGKQPSPDPVRLVMEYMRGTGAIGPADPPTLDADFYAALDASAHRPVDNAALEKATQQALAKKAYPDAVRDTLLTGKVFIGQQAARVVVHGASPKLTDALKVAMAKLQGTPLPSEDDNAAPTAPAAAAPLGKGKKAASPKLVKPSSAKPTGPAVVADANAKQPLTADEIRQLRDLAFGANQTSKPSYARWTRVADAVAGGKLKLDDLTDVPGQDDLNAVKSDLRWMAKDFDIGLGIEKKAFANPENRYDRLDVLPEQSLGTGQALKLFVPQPRASDAEVKAMLGRLSSLAQPSYDTKVADDALRTLALDEPIAALRVVGATLSHLPSPMNSDRVIESSMTGDELRGLQQTRFGGKAAPGAESWVRVAKAIDEGKVQLTDLNDPKGGSALDKDVAAVKAELRQMALGIHYNITGGEDAATTAIDQMAAKYNPLNTLPDPLGTAQSLVAQHFGVQGKQGGTLTLEDLDRMTKLADQFLTGRVTGAETFVKAFQDEKGTLARVTKAMQQKRLTYSFNQIRSDNPRDPALEADAATVMALFIQGADVLQTQAREKQAGWKGEASRTFTSVLLNAYKIPARGDDILPNSVEDWTVVALKAEMAAKNKGPDISITPTLRQAGQHVDEDIIKKLVAQWAVFGDGNISTETFSPEDKAVLQKAAAAFASGDLKEWDVKGGTEGETQQQLEVDNVIASAMDRHRQAMTTVDGAFLKYLVEQHGSLLGRSDMQTAMSGQPSVQLNNAQARDLLLRVAAQMEPGPKQSMQPWSSLNVGVGRMDDDPKKEADIIAAKLVVQEALSRLNSGAAGLGRDAVTAAESVKGMTGMNEPGLGPYLKAYCVQQGLISLPETAGIPGQKLNRQVLEASIKLGLRTAEALESRKDLADAYLMKQAVSTLQKAVAAGKDVTLGDDAFRAETKAVRDLLRQTVLAEGSTGHDIEPVDFGQLLGAGAVTIRHPKEGRVADAPLVSSFSDLTGRMGQKVSAFDSQKLSEDFKHWSENLQFDPWRALQTAGGSFLSFMPFGRAGASLMGTSVGYQLFVAPVVQTKHALTDWGYADDKGEASEALGTLQSIPRNWLGLQAQMLIMYRTGLPFWWNIGQDVHAGKLDVATGKAAVYVPLFGASTMSLLWGARYAWRSARERATNFTSPVEMQPYIGSSEAFPVGRVAGEMPNAGIRGAARVYQGAGAAWDFAVDGANLFFKPVYNGTGWVIRNTLRRNISLSDKATGLLSAEAPAPGAAPEAWLLTPEEVQEILAKPQGRTQFMVTRGTKSIPLDVSNEDLRTLAENKDPQISRNFARKMGITGPETDRIMVGLERAMKVPPATAELETGTPGVRTKVTLNDLDAHLADRQTWRVTIDGKVEEIELYNHDVARLVDAYYNSPTMPGETPPAYLQLLEKPTGLLRQERVVRAVIANFQGETVTSVQKLRLSALARRASVVAKTTPRVTVLEESRLGPGTKGKPLLTVKSGKTTVKVNPDADGELRVTAKGQDIGDTALGKKVLSTLDAVQAKYGVTKPVLQTTLAAIKSEAKALTDLTPAQLTALKAQTQAALTKAEKELARGGDRAAVNQLRARAAAIDLREQNASVALENDALRVRVKGADVTDTPAGQQVLTSLNNAQLGFSTTQSAQVAALAHLEAERVNWNQRFEELRNKQALHDAGKMTAAEKTKFEAENAQAHAEYKAWRGGSKALLEKGVTEADLATIGGRVRLNLLKARMAALDMSEAGIPATIAEGATATLAGLKSGLKSPCFYLVLATAGGKMIYDLGQSWNDESKGLSKIEKIRDAAFEGAKTGGIIVGTGLALKVAGKLLPRVGAVVGEAVSFVGWAYLIYDVASGNLERSVSETYHSMLGEQKDAVDGMKAWRALGIPEAGFFKVDEDQRQSWWRRYTESETSDDMGWLQDVGFHVRPGGWMEPNRKVDPRAQYWQAEDSPLVKRLQQLTNKKGEFFLKEDGFPTSWEALGKKFHNSFLQPQDLDLRQVKSYVEPVYPTVDLLKELPSLQKNDAVWGQVKSAQGFSFGTWQQGVKSAIDDGIVQYGTVDGQTFVNIDGDRLAELLDKNDHYANLTATQRKVLDRRLASDVEQATHWATQVNLMSISQADKQKALEQLVQNLAANHLANAMLFEYAPAKMATSTWRNPVYLTAPDAEVNIDDFYTLTQHVRGAWKRPY